MTNNCALYLTCKNTPGSFICEANPDPFAKCMGYNNKCSGSAVCQVRYEFSVKRLKVFCPKSFNKIQLILNIRTAEILFYFPQDFFALWLKFDEKQVQIYSG